jgi:hypothetical protein
MQRDWGGGGGYETLLNIIEPENTNFDPILPPAARYLAILRSIAAGFTAGGLSLLLSFFVFLAILIKAS